MPFLPADYHRAKHFEYRKQTIHISILQRTDRPRGLLGAGRRTRFQTDRVVLPRLTAELNCQLSRFLFY